MSCSPETRYETLSFFFDGVPDPNAPDLLDGPSANARNGSPNARKLRVSVHKPYRDNDCNACHVGNMRSFESFTKISDIVCMNCHKQVTDAYRYMHGPVAIGACLMCHDPHEAAQPHLIKIPSPKVCLQCHQRESLGPPDIAHLNNPNPEADCLSCHVGHGSSEHGLLLDYAVAPKEKEPVTEEPALPKNPQTPSPIPLASGDPL
ncbi:MAG: hypothetical protein JKX85_01550 [Phycisphaeraceae bacterium]|nr:hypothetical protein [Phycisphaeraceae bacterium]